MAIIRRRFVTIKPADFNWSKVKLWQSKENFEPLRVATPVCQVWQLPYLGFSIFQKQVTLWAKSSKFQSLFSNDYNRVSHKKFPLCLLPFSWPNFINMQSCYMLGTRILKIDPTIAEIFDVESFHLSFWKLTCCYYTEAEK